MQNVAIVAELTTNHFGDRERLGKMITASHRAGADYVKLQKRSVDTFYAPGQLAAPYSSPFGTTFGDYRRQLELTADDFGFVDDLCGRLGIGWFVSVLDRPSYEFIQQFSPGLVKLPSTISEHSDFLAHIGQMHGNSVVISTGMTDDAYESFILRTFARATKVYLLQCNSAYPTPTEHCNVGVISHYRDLSRTDSRIIPGYSSHDPGWLGSVAAVGAGALMVEKHVKLGDSPWAHFDDVAIDLAGDDFAAYVGHIRRAELVCGDGAELG